MADVAALPLSPQTLLVKSSNDSFFSVAATLGTLPSFFVASFSFSLANCARAGARVGGRRVGG